MVVDTDLSPRLTLLMQQVRSFTVNYTAPNGRFAKRYPALANVPFILDFCPRFHREGSVFLQDRALMTWGPRFRGKQMESRTPSPRSMKNYAQRLANFLEWCSVRGVDYHICSYTTHVAGRYQQEMLKGLWSSDGNSRSSSTVNARVTQASEFLSWLSDNGMRPPFEIPRTTITIRRGSSSSSIGHSSFRVQVREGKVPPKKRSLQMPDYEAVSAWVRRAYQREDIAEGLMFETVCSTAIRREEVVSMHADMLPEDRSTWAIVNPTAPPSEQQIRFTLRYGTKGRYYGTSQQGDKIGPDRDILVPLTLAEKWRAYIRKERNAAFANWMRNVRGAAREAHAKNFVHLFVRASDGAKFTGPMLYHRWTRGELPVAGWSPHDGRHWWACSILLRELKKQPSLKNVHPNHVGALIEHFARGIIQLQILPQLGHLDEKTTMLYLEWVTSMISVPLLLDVEDTCNSRGI